MKDKYIYIWTNKVTNKSYIGKTNERQARYNNFIQWDVHYAGPHIDRARLKYNDLKYWDYKILCQCYSEEELSEKEKYYIALYQSNDKTKGYNISSGGTWGDTWFALTDEERVERINKTVNTRKQKGLRWMTNGVIEKQIDKYHQQEYLDNGWTYGLSKTTATKISNSLKTSEKFKKVCEAKRLSEEELEKRNYMWGERLKKYRESQEYKDKMTAWKEQNRQRRIEYNKSEAHRQVAIESNKRRWKDGCPEETKQKMSETRKKYFKDKKIKWINNGQISKMVDESELEKYFEQGFVLGRLK